MRVAVLVAILGLITGGVKIRRSQDAPDLSSPKATLESLMTAYRKQDIPAMAKCIEGGSGKDVPQSLIDESAHYTEARLKILFAETKDDTAKVAVQLDITVGGEAVKLLNKVGARNDLTVMDLVTLKKEAAGWLVVPERLPSYMPADAVPAIVRPVESLAMLLGPDPTYRLALMAAVRRVQADQCLNNIRQLALGTAMYTEDYDEITPRSAVGYRDLIMPYLKNEELFTCSLDPKGVISYRMNENLQKRALIDIKDPENTVMLYEGKEGKLNFRHDGKAAVAFADGHVKLVTEEAAKALVWKLPPAATPKKAAKAKH